MCVFLLLSSNLPPSTLDGLRSRVVVLHSPLVPSLSPSVSSPWTPVH